LTPLKIRSLRWALPAAILVVLAAAHSLWLRALGNFLTSEQEPFHADIIVVLAGGDTGNRILTAAGLVKRGYAPRILVSGPACCYGHRESDLAIAFAVAHGYPADWFIGFPIDGKSTQEEAHEIVPELARRHVDRFLVVTSNYHTRRAGSIYRELTAPERFRVVAAPDPLFRPDDWWQSRDGRKTWFLEWAKTMGNWAGL
jgi:uncharacterized SAM-binding protein YcdF (DUF218 family)